MCIKNNLIKGHNKKEIDIRCWRCGRIIYEDLQTGRTGCRNTKCISYLLGSKNWDNSRLRKVTTTINAKSKNKS